MDNGKTSLRWGSREWTGWKADVIVFTVGAGALGIAFLAGLAVGIAA